ncbi:hypothetical protein TIFTF001_054167 [Ficus carica]|nr:hypothetical protein TIFTF001_054167 [Ficus carica]
MSVIKSGGHQGERGKEESSPSAARASTKREFRALNRRFNQNNEINMDEVSKQLPLRRLSHSHSSRFQRTDRSMNLLPLFPTGEGQVGSWEEYESCKRCHPDLEEVMGKLLVQPTEGKLLADLYSIEGSSLNQLLPYPSKVRTVSRAKDFDLRLKNKARERPLLT